MKSFLLFFLLVGCAFRFGYGQIIVNHQHTNITTLTEQEINLAKNVLHIAYGHTSHGSQITDGMTGLVTFANNGGKGMTHPTDIFRWNNGGTSGALDLHDGAMGGDVGYYPQWVTNTTNYLGAADPITGMGTNHTDVNVIMWSWCGQAAGYSETDMINKYLAPMSQLEETYPNVKFIYMTCHLNGTGVNGNLNLRNEQIRNFCIANKKILYDFADIESYDPDGLVNYMLLNADDNCDYDSDGNGSRDKNWALDWQNSHTQNTHWYYCYAAHSQSLNGNQKAYAAWRMYAEIAKALTIPINHFVSDTVTISGQENCFNAYDTLFVASPGSVVIESGGIAEFIAGKSIRFLPGFHAEENSSVRAWITTDSSFCYQQSTSPSPIIAQDNTKSIGSDFNQQALTDDVLPLMKVYPNPNNGIFTLQFNNIENNTRVMIYNTLGKKVYETTFNGETHLVELPNIHRGIYLVKAISGQKQFVRKVLVQ
jgi:hypothetical protein